MRGRSRDIVVFVALLGALGCGHSGSSPDADIGATDAKRLDDARTVATADASGSADTGADARTTLDAADAGAADADIVHDAGKEAATPDASATAALPFRGGYYNTSWNSPPLAEINWPAW